MTSQQSTDHDRETLSALHDGELEGEARLFALRRLSHDAGWQADVGRWQLIGDAMRRQAPIAAPADLAGRVHAAVAAERVPVSTRASTSIRAAAPARRRVLPWAGGALAASLALVGVFALRGTPDAAPPSVAIDAPSPAAAQPAEVVAAVPQVDLPTPTASQSEAPPAPRRVTSDARVASVERTPARVARAEVRRATAAPASAPIDATAFARPVASNPFHVSASDALTSRPWPRATLPGASTTLNASYGAASGDAGAAPSFFPFEPRPRADATADSPSP